MKKTIFVGLLAIALSVTQYSIAQQPENVEQDCEKKLNAARVYFPFLNQLTTAHKKEILTAISPCIKLDDLEERYYRGQLHLGINDAEHTFAEGYRIIDSLSRYGYTAASRAMGILWKQGKGLGQLGYVYTSLGTANLWFTKAYPQDAIAAYALGYFRMKGFPSPANQNYADAIDYYTQSSYPMAKHWLGISHYFGFGVPQNKPMGLQLLADNDIPNSQLLREHLIANPFVNPTLSIEEQAAMDNRNIGRPTKFYNNKKRSFVGNLVEYDWSGKQVLRKIPVTLAIEYYFASRADLEIEIEGRTLNMQVGLKEGTNTFTNGKITCSLPSLYPDHPSRIELDYNIDRASFFQVPVNDSQSYVVAHAYGEIANLNERTTGLVFILEETTPTTKSQDTTSVAYDDTPVITNTDFATIAPNPVQDRFTITYTLGQPALVRVEVYDLLGRKRLEQIKDQSISSGKQSITMDSASLSSGTYIVHITVGNQVSTNRIIKL